LRRLYIGAGRSDYIKGGGTVKLKLSKSRAIGPQLCEQLCASIVAGDSKPGQRLMSVRELAMSLGVNPNTVQHAFEQLAQQGILYSQQGSGWYIADDTSAAHALHAKVVRDKLAEFFREMEQMGMPPEEAKKLVEEWSDG
jgi:DNA-binding transcriptional regulator YhcF (GntR family)